MLVSNPFNIAYDLDRAARGWWVLLANGIITVLAGGIILFTDWKLSDLVVFVGAVLVFVGPKRFLGDEERRALDRAAGMLIGLARRDRAAARADAAAGSDPLTGVLTRSALLADQGPGAADGRSASAR